MFHVPEVVAALGAARALAASGDTLGACDALNNLAGKFDVEDWGSALGVASAV
jgi:hypothetical protein